VLSRLRLRVVKLIGARDYPGSVPAVGDVIEAVGFTAIGASGEREIYTESLRR
jgi:hypothetical protein